MLDGWCGWVGFLGVVCEDVGDVELRDCGEHLRVEEGGYVVDDVGLVLCDGFACDVGSVGVDGDYGVGVVCAYGLECVFESAPFLVGCWGCGAWACGACSEVDDVCALCEYLVGSGSYLVGGVVFAAVVEGVGCDVEDAHDEWGLGGEEVAVAVDGVCWGHCGLCLKREKLTLP